MTVRQRAGLFSERYKRERAAEPLSRVGHLSGLKAPTCVGLCGAAPPARPLPLARSLSLTLQEKMRGLHDSRGPERVRGGDRGRGSAEGRCLEGVGAWRRSGQVLGGGAGGVAVSGGTEAPRSGGA